MQIEHILSVVMTLRNAVSEEMQGNSPLLSRGDTTVHLQCLLVPVLTACADSLKTGQYSCTAVS